MIGLALRIAGLAAIYLLVLTSVAPGDIVVGAVLAAALVVTSGAHTPRRSAGGWGRWAIAFARMTVVTAWDITVGAARVARFCIAGGASPGFVEIPRGDRARRGVALWGILTGEAPDEYPVAVDDARHVLVVHIIDDRDPHAIRARHADRRMRHEREVAQ
jgi:multisubunit Na+/H+ antiporter MnhE subunit